MDLGRETSTLIITVIILGTPYNTKPFRRSRGNYSVPGVALELCRDLLRA